MNPLWVLLLAISMGSSAWARVRKVEITQDQIATVRTAIGIATIVQVPDRPNSIVVGDQSAFKVEYLDQAITIKPLRSGAKSNLYVYTDYRRFNVQLVTGPEPSADYVVYLENPKPKPQLSTIRWMSIHRSESCDDISINLDRVARTRDGVLLIEFRLTSIKSLAIKPEWFWLLQAGKPRPIQNLALSSLSLDSRSPVSGTIQLLRSDVNENSSLRIELRRMKICTVTAPKVVSWK